MRARFAASILLAATVALASSGCTFIAPIATEFEYAPGDGADATVGSVKVRNALLVTDEGTRGSLAMAVSNDGSEPVEVLFQYNFDSGNPGEFRIALEPGEFISFGSEHAEPIVLTEVDLQVGSTFPIFVQYGSKTGSIMAVPVYDGRLDRFAPLVPEAPQPVDTTAPEPETDEEQPADVPTPEPEPTTEP